MRQMNDFECLGAIELCSIIFIPYGYTPCDGRPLNIDENNTLFSLLGAKYGGDGSATFALPDMRGLQPYPNQQYVICTSGIYPSCG